MTHRRAALAVVAWRTRFASLAKAVRIDVNDVAALSGAGLLSYGAGEIYRPAGFIVMGGLLIVGAFLNARAKS